MKIISVDNYDREIPGQSDERLHLIVCSENIASEIVCLLNLDTADSTRYFKVVANDYTLKTYNY